jgi:glycosyltransferase involved in cell wall biosynthesis
MRIAISVPEMHQLKWVMEGRPADATHIIQGHIAAGLQAQGHKLTFIAPNYLEEIVCTDDVRQPRLAPQTWTAGQWFQVASKGSWRIQQLLGVPYLNVFSNYRLMDACTQCLPGHDIVYERNILYKSGVAMACKRLGLPYVLYFEADDILEHDYMGKSITGLQRWRASEAIRNNLNSATCIISVSEQGKNHLATNWGIAAEKIVVFPNAADVDRFQPSPERSSTMRATLGIGNNPLILFVGSFYEWHDVATLLDAFSQVLVQHPEARLVLVGDGSQRQAMMNRVNDLGIAETVQFTGQVAHDGVPHWMSAADIAVVPYPRMDHELWLSPLKLFEYMASGTAVIASAVGQLPRIIQDGKNGLLVPPGDVTAMTIALKCLIEDSMLRSKLGQQARQDSVRKYSWDQYISRLERLFTAVVAGQPFSQI